jgi:NAD(P)H-flavin reductase
LHEKSSWQKISIARFDLLTPDGSRLTLSRPHEPWHGLRGYAQQQVPDIVQRRADGHAYICGLDKMVRANRQLLDSLDWDRKRIGYENYV